MAGWPGWPASSSAETDEPTQEDKDEYINDNLLLSPQFRAPHFTSTVSANTQELRTMTELHQLQRRPVQKETHMNEEVLAALSKVAEELNQAQAEFEYRKQLKIEVQGFRDRGQFLEAEVLEEVANGELPIGVGRQVVKDLIERSQLHEEQDSLALIQSTINPVAPPAILSAVKHDQRWGHFTSNPGLMAKVGIKAKKSMVPSPGSRAVTPSISKSEGRGKGVPKESWQAVMAQKKRDLYMTRLNNILADKMPRVTQEFAARTIQRAWRQRRAQKVAAEDAERAVRVAALGWATVQLVKLEAEVEAVEAEIEEFVEEESGWKTSTVRSICLRQRPAIAFGAGFENSRGPSMSGTPRSRGPSMNGAASTPLIRSASRRISTNEGRVAFDTTPNVRGSISGIAFARTGTRRSSLSGGPSNVGFSHSLRSRVSLTRAVTSGSRSRSSLSGAMQVSSISRVEVGSCRRLSEQASQGALAEEDEEDGVLSEGEHDRGDEGGDSWEGVEEEEEGVRDGVAQVEPAKRKEVKVEQVQESEDSVFSSEELTDSAEEEYAGADIGLVYFPDSLGLPGSPTEEEVSGSMGSSPRRAQINAFPSRGRKSQGPSIDIATSRAHPQGFNKISNMLALAAANASASRSNRLRSHRSGGLASSGGLFSSGGLASSGRLASRASRPPTYDAGADDVMALQSRSLKVQHQPSREQPKAAPLEVQASDQSLKLLGAVAVQCALQAEVQVQVQARPAASRREAAVDDDWGLPAGPEEGSPDLLNSLGGDGLIGRGLGRRGGDRWDAWPGSPQVGQSTGMSKAEADTFELLFALSRMTVPPPNSPRGRHGGAERHRGRRSGIGSHQVEAPPSLTSIGKDPHDSGAEHVRQFKPAPAARWSTRAEQAPQNGIGDGLIMSVGKTGKRESYHAELVGRSPLGDLPSAQGTGYGSGAKSGKLPSGVPLQDYSEDGLEEAAPLALGGVSRPCARLGVRINAASTSNPRRLPIRSKMSLRLEARVIAVARQQQQQQQQEQDPDYNLRQQLQWQRQQQLEQEHLHQQQQLLQQHLHPPQYLHQHQHMPQPQHLKQQQQQDLTGALQCTSFQPPPPMSDAMQYIPGHTAAVVTEPLLPNFYSQNKRRRPTMHEWRVYRARMQALQEERAKQAAAADAAAGIRPQQPGGSASLELRLAMMQQAIQGLQPKAQAEQAARALAEAVARRQQQQGGVRPENWCLEHEIDSIKSALGLRGKGCALHQVPSPLPGFTHNTATAPATTERVQAGLDRHSQTRQPPRQPACSAAPQSTWLQRHLAYLSVHTPNRRQQASRQARRRLRSRGKGRPSSTAEMVQQAGIAVRAARAAVLEKVAGGKGARRQQAGPSIWDGSRAWSSDQEDIQQRRRRVQERAQRVQLAGPLQQVAVSTPRGRVQEVFHPMQHGVLPLEAALSIVVQPLHPMTSQFLHPVVSQPAHSAPSQPLQLAPIQPLHPAPIQPLHPAPSQPLHPAHSQPLHPPAYQLLHPAPSQPFHSVVTQPLHPVVCQPLHPVPSQPFHPAPSQLLQPPLMHAPGHDVGSAKMHLPHLAQPIRAALSAQATHSHLKPVGSVPALQVAQGPQQPLGYLHGTLEPEYPQASLSSPNRHPRNEPDHPDPPRPPTVAHLLAPGILKVPRWSVSPTGRAASMVPMDMMGRTFSSASGATNWSVGAMPGTGVGPTSARPAAYGISAPLPAAHSADQAPSDSLALLVAVWDSRQAEISGAVQLKAGPAKKNAQGRQALLHQLDEPDHKREHQRQSALHHGRELQARPHAASKGDMPSWVRRNAPAAHLPAVVQGGGHFSLPGAAAGGTAGCPLPRAENHAGAASLCFPEIESGQDSTRQRPVPKYLPATAFVTKAMREFEAHQNAFRENHLPVHESTLQLPQLPGFERMSAVCGLQQS